MPILVLNLHCLMYKWSGRPDCIDSFALNGSASFDIKNFILSSKALRPLLSRLSNREQAKPVADSRPQFALFNVQMERTTGLEPATSTLGRLHSTTELRPLIGLLYHKFYKSKSMLVGYTCPTVTKRGFLIFILILFLFNW